MLRNLQKINAGLGKIIEFRAIDGTPTKRENLEASAGAGLFGAYALHSSIPRIMGSMKKDSVKQLSALLDGIIHFTSISATKGLLKDLRKQGVKISREATERGGEYVPSFLFMSKRGMGSGVPSSPEALEKLKRDLPAKIRITKSKAVLAKTHMGPRETLWHEAGHHVAKTGDFMHEKRSMANLVRDTISLPMEDQMKAGFKHQADIAIRKEVKANRGAIKMMRQRGVPESRVLDYKNKARKQVGGYEGAYSGGVQF